MNVCININVHLCVYIHVFLRSSRGATVNMEGENHRSPLHEAASGGHVSIVELLIKEGANPCPRDNHDATPYDLAYAGGHKEVCCIRIMCPYTSYM